MKTWGQTRFRWRLPFLSGRVPLDPLDRRYPRPKGVRLLRWVFRLWWLAFIFYFPNALFNLWTLVAHHGLSALLIYSNITQALLVDQLLLLLAHRTWVIAPLIAAIAFFILLGHWAHKDQEHERDVLTLRETQEKEQRKQQEQLFEVEKQGNRVIKEIHGVIDPLVSPPFDETVARLDYLNGLCKRYSTVTLPIGPLRGLHFKQYFSH